MTAARRHLLLVPAVCLGLTAGACKDDAPDFKTLTLSGTVEKIDLANHRVQISFYSEKHGRKLTQEAAVGDRTEVFINGISARLEDVKVGEHADGEVIVTKKGEERVKTISKVHIRRSEAIAASHPAAGNTQASPDAPPKPGGN